jgi:hypothetical protein
MRSGERQHSSYITGGRTDLYLSSGQSLDLLSELLIGEESGFMDMSYQANLTDISSV